jgi:FeS assembly SUF system regulator
MLRMSRISDYGIVLLAHLASDPAAETSNARRLADEARLPFPVVSKVLKLLTQGGILVSHRGTKGGYGLARSASEISVADIIRSLEGPLALVECTAGPGHCHHESTCVVRSPWQRINGVIVEALSRVTLSELLDPPSGGLAPLAPGPRGDRPAAPAGSA